METINSYIKRSQGRHSCSLLIPFMYQDIFGKALIKYGSVRLILNNLLDKYGHTPEIIPSPESGPYTIKYQEQFLNLKKYNFLPNEDDWVKIKILATLKGISIAYLFVLLLLMDGEGGSLPSYHTGTHVPQRSLTLIRHLGLHSPLLSTHKIRITIRI